MDPRVVQRHINGQRKKDDIQMSNDIVLVKIGDTCRSNNSKKTHKNCICSQKDKYQNSERYLAIRNEQEQGSKIK